MSILKIDQQPLNDTHLDMALLYKEMANLFQTFSKSSSDTQSCASRHEASPLGEVTRLFWWNPKFKVESRPQESR